MKYRATLRQHAVGQGGLMSGLLEIPRGHFHWVYDCGSNQSDALIREIDGLRSRGRVQCLFLSHLDSDHMIGVDRLLTTLGGADEVVLPYLNNMDRIIAVAHDVSNGALTGAFVEFLSDIAGWFSARGVDRVTYLVPGGDDGPETPSPILPEGGLQGREGQISAKWKRPVGASQDDGSHADGAVQSVQSGSVMVAMASGMFLDWVFVPYAHRPSDKAIKAFRRALFERFGPGYRSRSFLAGLIKTPDGFDDMRAAYDLIWSDHNLVSMALYAGPVHTSWRDHRSISSPRHRFIWQQNRAVGWLETGDMNLRSAIRRRAFANHYRQLLPQVNVFALPHHGSHRSFHSDLLASLPNASDCLATAGPNGYGHPHDAVVQAVRSAGLEFTKVSEEAFTSLWWQHSL